MKGSPDVSVVEMVRMTDEWLDIASEEAGITRHWASEIARMRDEQLRLRQEGQWRSGGRTLLRALWFHHDEVVLCRGLAWLLTPDGWHGLGSAVLVGLLDALGLASEGAAGAVVVTEERRDDTRADVIVRFDGTTLLIEAKVWAPEQEQQADRLAEHWSDESATLVFLTRDGRSPATGVVSRELWKPISWGAVAALIRTAIGAHPDCEPGVREYLRTLEIYGGTPS